MRFDFRFEGQESRTKTPVITAHPSARKDG